ncbi:MFS transporter [Carnobacterium gallinarum]|uniref:MFS transporter n=1 Tax=Carnobacterium gallinarum TaxID=2749 RepID=UPI0012F83E85|nr:MFS transporter [Carnobacterium gallinarum]
MAILAPVWSQLAKNQPWQTTYKNLAIFLIILLPLTILTLKNPDSKKSASIPVIPSTWTMAIHSAFHTPLIKYVFSAVFVCGFSMGIIDTQLVSMMIKNQLTTNHTGTLMSLFGIGVILGGLLVGVTSDRYQRKVTILKWLFLGRAINFPILLLPLAPMLQFTLFVLLFGFTYSGVVMLAVILIVEHTTAATGKLLALNILIHQFSGLLGVYLSSKLLDLFDSYFSISLIALTLSVFVLLYALKLNTLKSNLL